LRDLARQASAEPLRAPGEDDLLEAARRGDGEARERLIRPRLRVVIDEAVAHREVARLTERGYRQRRPPPSSDPSRRRPGAHTFRAIGEASHTIPGGAWGSQGAYTAGRFRRTS